MQFTERSIATIKRYEMDIDVELVFLKCLQRTIQMWLRWVYCVIVINALLFALSYRTNTRVHINKECVT